MSIASRAVRAPVLMLGLALCAPAPVARGQESHASQHSHSIWTENGRTLEVESSGRVTYGDDDASVASLSPGGWFRLEERRPGQPVRWVEYRAREGGGMVRSYRVNGESRPFDESAESWLRSVLPEWIRESGANAEARVERIHRRSGTGGVLDEIERIHSDGVRRLYYSVLLQRHALDAGETTRLLKGAARIDSDGDKAAVLRLVGEGRRVTEPGVRDAFFEGARTIQSDGDHSAVLLALLGSHGADAGVQAGVLRSARGIQSDGDKSRVLIDAASRADLRDEALRREFFATANTVQSDGDHTRVLEAVAARGASDPGIWMALIESASRIQSDGDKTRVLLCVPREQLERGAVRAAYAEALRTIQSEGDRARATERLLESRA